MNRCIFLIRLVRDAELGYIPGSGTAKLSFTGAVDRDYKTKEGNKITDFINFELNGSRAEKLAQYLTKGTLLTVEGSLRITNYTDNDGNKKTWTSINVDKVNFVPGQKKEEKQEGAPFDPSVLDVDGFTMEDDSDSIPF